MRKDILQGDYSKSQFNYQFKLPLELWAMIPVDDPVRLLSAVVESMDLTPLYATYESLRKMTYAPKTLLKVLIYGYMNGEYSTRRIARCCERDINFMFLLEGCGAPDHATISRFRTKHFARCSEAIMAQMTGILHELGEISGIDLFIDGTKIEADANKYTFVWKRATVTNQGKLEAKMAAVARELEQDYGLPPAEDGEVTVESMQKILDALLRIRETEKIEFVHGKGTRKTQLQRDVEKLEEYLGRWREYEHRIAMCGDRNSYSKTDPDATFMRMKEDAMGNGQLKPAYNLQHGVDSEYIVWLMTSASPTDTPTLIPFLEAAENALPFRYSNIVADAGYESEENYRWLAEHNYEAFIKPTNYEISKTRKYRNDIGRAENMVYDAELDAYTCAEGKSLPFVYSRKQTTATGNVRESKVYSCSECDGCPRKAECIHGRSTKPLEERSKNLYVSHVFNEYREDARERITSEHGTLLRVNRSIQAEGSFGELKWNMGFRRFLCRSTTKVTAELILLALAANINKLHNKIQDRRTASHLFPLKEVA